VAGGDAENAFGLLSKKIVGLGGGLGEAEEGVADAGVVTAFEFRQKVVADAVAGEVG
jgi:hypothetical protein